MIERIRVTLRRGEEPEFSDRDTGERFDPEQHEHGCEHILAQMRRASEVVEPGRTVTFDLSNIGTPSARVRAAIGDFYATVAETEGQALRERVRALEAWGDRHPPTIAERAMGWLLATLRLPLASSEEGAREQVVEATDDSFRRIGDAKVDDERAAALRACKADHDGEVAQRAARLVAVEKPPP